MNKTEKTINDLKKNIEKLKKELEKKTKGLDPETKAKIKALEEKTVAAINSSIEKIKVAIKNFGEDEDFNALLDKIKAKTKEAVDYTLNKVDDIINGKNEYTLNDLHNEIMAEYDKIKETETFKRTKVLVKEGYSKINEFLEKPEVKSSIKKAKLTTINMAEKGVAGLKKVLDVEETKKKKYKNAKTKAKTKTKATKKNEIP